jgi:hypothetical protein
MKITDAGRELRPEDLRGAKMVFVVGYTTVAAADGTVTRAWHWHQATELVHGDTLHGPFKSESAEGCTGKLRDDELVPRLKGRLQATL